MIVPARHQKENLALCTQDNPNPNPDKGQINQIPLPFHLPSSPSPPPACAAGPSSAAPPALVSPAASDGSSASPRGRSTTAACCARSGSSGRGSPVRKSSPGRTSRQLWGNLFTIQLWLQHDRVWMQTSPHCAAASLVSSLWRFWRFSLDRPLAFFSSNSGGLVVHRYSSCWGDT